MKVGDRVKVLAPNEELFGWHNHEGKTGVIKSEHFDRTDDAPWQYNITFDDPADCDADFGASELEVI